MPNDNVTPFRRPPPRPAAPQQQGGFGFKTHRGKVLLVHILTMLCFGLPFVLAFPGSNFVTLAFGIAAGVIALTSRADATPWAATHHLQALHTLIIAMVAGLLLQLPYYLLTPDLLQSAAGVLAPVMFWGGLIVAIWALLRAAIGLVMATMRRAMPNPRGLLI